MDKWEIQLIKWVRIIASSRYRDIIGLFEDFLFLKEAYS